MRSPYDDEGTALTQHARVTSPDGLYMHFTDGRGTPAAGGAPRSAATEPGSSASMQGATPPPQWETPPSAGGAGRKTRAQQLLEFAVAQSREEAAEEQIHMAFPADKMQMLQYGSSPQRADAAPHESGAVAGRGTEYGRFASPSAGDTNAACGARPVDSAGQRGTEAAASPQPPRLFSSGAMAVAAARHAGMRVAMANHNLAHPQMETATREDRQFYYY